MYNVNTGATTLQKPVSVKKMLELGADFFIEELRKEFEEYNSYNETQFASDKWGRVKDELYDTARMEDNTVDTLEDEEVKNSVRELPDVTKCVELDTDQDIFKGINNNPSKIRKVAAEYISRCSKGRTCMTGSRSLQKEEMNICM